MKRLQVIAKNLLLAFVLVTIGFALGKESARRQALPVAAPAAEAGSEVSRGTRVIVYSTHATLRCVTCNTIERLAKQTVEDRFADELAAGRVAWRIVNFQEDEVFADRYDIASSCVVVAGMRGDDETGFKRLDEVWTKVDDPAAFSDYISDAIQGFLEATP